MANPEEVIHRIPIVGRCAKCGILLTGTEDDAINHFNDVHGEKIKPSRQRREEGGEAYG